MTELTFMDELPEAAGGSAKTRDRAAEVKANPGKWAQWPSQTPATAIQKALDKIGAGYEVTGRRCADGKTRAFVRYVAPEVNGNGNGNGHTAPSGPPPASAPTKVKCPSCAQFITILADEDNADALSRHERTNTVCRAANRRR